MNVLIDSRTKGLPHSSVDLGVADIDANQWNVLAEHLPLPIALLRNSALEENRRWMAEFIARTHVKLAPHGKTTMSPALFAMQIADGAWAITLATVQQVRVARQAGIGRILLANEVVGARDIAYLLDELDGDPSFEFYCLVDSLEGVKRLQEAKSLRSPGRPLQVLIEMGYAGGRAGCRNIDTALTVARAIKTAGPHLTLCGVEGFEGLHQPLPANEDVIQVRTFLDRIVALAQTLDEEDLFGVEEIILSAGGSAYYDLVIEVFGGAQLRRSTSIVLRSGCYLTHDAGIYERAFGSILDRSSIARGIEARFKNALEVWAYVLSVPEPGRAIIAAGRRDFGHDMGLPVPLKTFRPGKAGRPDDISADHKIVAVNDQHAHMTFPATSDMRVGDMIALGVSHPCTTFDKWQLLYIVDDDYNVKTAMPSYF